MQAFTIKANPAGLLKILCSPIDIIIPNSDEKVNVSAIWDTGATGSVITKNVANTLGLIPTGRRTVSTANGLAEQNTYTISIRLTNGVQVQGVTVTEVDVFPAARRL